MKYKELISLIYSDLYRYTGNRKGLVKNYFLIAGFHYTCLMRFVKYFSCHKKYFLFKVLFQLRLRHYMFKFGIQIPYQTQIGKGFYIGHFGDIVISPDSIIGNNVNISQGVTIGKANRGTNKGAAIIGNEVYIGPGAKIVGKVMIGNNVAIGANAVVTHDIPDNATVGGGTG
jgi:serine O-acetyltransferase